MIDFTATYFRPVAEAFTLYCCEECVSPQYDTYAAAEMARAALPGFLESSAALPGCNRKAEAGGLFSGVPFVVPVFPDHAAPPVMSVSTSHGVQLLAVLGYLHNDAPDEIDFGHIESEAASIDRLSSASLEGEVTPQDMLGRILLAQALIGSDAGRAPLASERPGSCYTDFGRRPGYFDERLSQLIEIVDWAQANGQNVLWH